MKREGSVPRTPYYRSGFLNVPLDRDYYPLLYAIVFAIYDCGYVARCALDTDDSTQVRIAKLYDLIFRSKYGIHDISRTQLDKRNRLPRFNMPLELGIFLGAKAYGTARHRQKSGLILDRTRYRYQKFCSDIAGQDIRAHNEAPKHAIRRVRDWLRAQPDASGTVLPAGGYIHSRYLGFRRQLPKLCRRLNREPDDLSFNDYAVLISGWLQANPR